LGIERNFNSFRHSGFGVGVGVGVGFGFGSILTLGGFSLGGGLELCPNTIIAPPIIKTNINKVFLNIFFIQ
jgi:hypothetical protein